MSLGRVAYEDATPYHAKRVPRMHSRVRLSGDPPWWGSPMSPLNSRLSPDRLEFSCSLTMQLPWRSRPRSQAAGVTVSHLAQVWPSRSPRLFGAPVGLLLCRCLKWHNLIKPRRPCAGAHVRLVKNAAGVCASSVGWSSPVAAVYT